MSAPLVVKDSNGNNHFLLVDSNGNLQVTSINDLQALQAYVGGGTTQGGTALPANKSLVDLLTAWLNNSGNVLPATTSMYDALTLQLQTAAQLSQTSPAQNTYYDILAVTKNVMPLIVSCAVATTGETLQVRVIIDGRTLTASIAASAGTTYYASLINNGGALSLQLSSTAAVFNTAITNVREFRSVQISVEKTTNSGSGTITGTVEYMKR